MVEYTCANCKKEGSKKKCGACKSIFYCSKECQVSHWKTQHRKNCEVLKQCRNMRESTEGGCEQSFGPAGVFNPSESYEVSEMDYMMSHLMGAAAGDSKDVSSEYRKVFPNDINQHGRIRMEEKIYKDAIFMEQMSKGKMFLDEVFSKMCYQKRWGSVWVYDKKRLVKFLSSPRILGDIFEPKNIRAYQEEIYQTMRNTSTIDMIYESGKNYIGIGYVDLSSLLWGAYRYVEKGEPLNYYGYEASCVVCLRSKLIYQLLKMESSDITLHSILQIWFSSCLDEEGKKSLQIVLKYFLENHVELQLSVEEIEILKIWKKKKISTEKAKLSFSAYLQNKHFDDIWRMKYEKDRVMFLRYLFTGCVFMNENEAVCGNSTMFAQLNGYTKISSFENFFQSVDLRGTRLAKCPTDKVLFEAITNVAIDAARCLREYIQSGKLICHLFHQKVTTDNISLAKSIQDLDPYMISWSNVPDYLEKKSFIKFARACSTDDTLHYVTFINWTIYVYGSVHVDFEYDREKLERIYKEFLQSQKTMEKDLGRLIKVSGEQNFSENYFTGKPYVNRLNGVNTFLATMNRSKFEDYFLSDEDGVPLNRYEETVVDSLITSFFHQSPTTFHAGFTFNRGMKMHVGSC